MLLYFSPAAGQEDEPPPPPEEKATSTTSGRELQPMDATASTLIPVNQK
jgi:hypothetical protein